MVAARKALPRLFAEIDELRARTRGVPALGTVNLGTVFEAQGRLGEAREHYERCLALSREIGYRLVEAVATGNLGVVLSRGGRFRDPPFRIATPAAIAPPALVASRSIEDAPLVRRARGSETACMAKSESKNRAHPSRRPDPLDSWMRSAERAAAELAMHNDELVELARTDPARAAELAEMLARMKAKCDMVIDQLGARIAQLAEIDRAKTPSACVPRLVFRNRRKRGG